ncbi:MAG TPA: ankyrin repeat domain-containing protein [Steroidobacter sp.]|uniref:ankyrin repeat domain-containing protein n=1 Tax=Steroidobacter sp. TaxID=1978227 RepID=UPI002ED83E73
MPSFDSARPYRSLPRSPDLGRLRDEAKSLKKLCASGDPTAVGFVDFHLGRTTGAVKLADAQFALARSYGFKSWARLKAFVEAQSRSPAERGALLLQSLFTDNHALLQELYDRREGLPASDFFIAAALGNVTVVETMLAADPAWASRVGGPMQTQAITYAAYARFGMVDDTYPPRQQRIVTLLLSHGADPNSFVHEESRGKGDGRLSALYGCCRQPGNPTIAKLLLDAGASTDDGESLYHASELSDTRCLELLFAAGVPERDRDFCICRALDFENPDAIAVYLRNGANPNHLDWALFRNRSLRIIELLVEHGADLNQPCGDYWLLERLRGLTPVQMAERAGAVEAVSYLLERGATDSRTPTDRLIGACARADEDAARLILREHPNIVGTLTKRDLGNIATFARDSRLKSVQLMLEIGFDIEARADDLDATALHYAATNGDVPMVKLLLGHRARLDVKHKYGGTPLDTAIYCAANHRNDDGRYAEAVELLVEASHEPLDDYLKFAIESDLDDIADVLKAHGASL